MSGEDVEELAHAIIAWAERVKSEQLPQDLKRLLHVYRATIGAPSTWGVSERRGVGARIVTALLPNLRLAVGTRRTHLHQLLAALLAIECEEPAFGRIPWDRRDDEVIRRFEAVRVLAWFSVRVGAWKTEPLDPPDQEALDGEVDAIKKAMAKDRLNTKRKAHRRRRSAITKG